MSRKFTATERVFLEICRGVGMLLVNVVDAPLTVAHRRSMAMRRRALPTTDGTRQAIRRLEKRSWIRTEGKGQDTRISLTKAGVAHSIATCVEFHRTPLPKGWVCIVMFDIPENLRGVRRELRLLLKRLGFRPYQQSVWIAKHDAAFHLKFFVKYTGMQKWVRVFTATEKTRADQKRPAGHF